jgi:hypothetical protein
MSQHSLFFIPYSFWPKNLKIGAPRPSPLNRPPKFPLMAAIEVVKLSVTKNNGYGKAIDFGDG